MVTLASAKQTSNSSSPANCGSKTPNRLDRQQHFRSSKKFKRQPQSATLNDNFNLNFNTFNVTNNITNFHNFNSNQFNSNSIGTGMGSPSSSTTTTTISTPIQPTLQLLACYEDSSFIYCQNSTPSSVSPQSKHSFNSSSSFSATDSMISPTSSASSSSLDSSSLQMQSLVRNASSDYSSSYVASPSCISALDYCHLSSSTSYHYNANKQQHKSFPLDNQLQVANSQNNHQQNIRHFNHFNQRHFNQQAFSGQQHHNHQHPLQPIQSSTTTNNALDSVYLEDNEVFYNLILKESSELKRRQLVSLGRQQQVGNENADSGGQVILVEQPLAGQLRHSLLSWMLKVCEHQMCQDEIFPLATMILDKFLLFHPQAPSTSGNKNGNKRLLSELDQNNGLEELYHNSSNGGNQQVDEELNQRQLYLFAACSLLLATKLRQTPRLCVQILIEFSLDELPVELNREEILDGELLILATLKWDLAALVTPNDFLALLLSKCQNLLSSSSSSSEEEEEEEEEGEEPTTAGGHHHQHTGLATATTNVHEKRANRCDQSRVRRHTQTLLELCLMDSQLSQFSPSVLAMASMAVAIDGLSMTEKTCWHLNEIVAQIHEATHKVNELKQMIDVAFQIEKYVQKLLNSTHDD